TICSFLNCVGFSHASTPLEKRRIVRPRSSINRVSLTVPGSGARSMRLRDEAVSVHGVTRTALAAVIAACSSASVGVLMFGFCGGGREVAGCAAAGDRFRLGRHFGMGDGGQPLLQEPVLVSDAGARLAGEEDADVLGGERQAVLLVLLGVGALVERRQPFLRP